MAKPILDDELWAIIEPILPPPKRRRWRYPGRKPIGHRQALSGIIFVLKTGIPWEYLPQELGFGSGMTCWRRLEAWQRRGVWKRVQEVLLARLQEANRIDWSRAIIDSASVRAVFGGSPPAPTPRTAGKKARSTMWSRTPTVFRWRPRSRRPTATT